MDNNFYEKNDYLDAIGFSLPIINNSGNSLETELLGMISSGNRAFDNTFSARIDFSWLQFI